jgi:hypothetical protein
MESECSYHAHKSLSFVLMIIAGKYEEVLIEKAMKCKAGGCSCDSVNESEQCDVDMLPVNTQLHISLVLARVQLTPSVISRTLGRVRQSSNLGNSDHWQTANLLEAHIRQV